MEHGKFARIFGGETFSWVSSFQRSLAIQLRQSVISVFNKVIASDLYNIVLSDIGELTWIRHRLFLLHT